MHVSLDNLCMLLFPYLWVFTHLQYGKDYEFDAPVKLLDKHLHAMAQSVDEQLVVVSQVRFLSHLIFMFPKISVLIYVQNCPGSCS